MADIFSPEDIDFAAYERETEVQQKVKKAGLYVNELIERIRNPVREIRTVMPWRKTHGLFSFRPGEVTVWGGANHSGKSLVTGQLALSLCAQNERVCVASFEMKPLKTLQRMGRQWSNFNPEDPAFAGSAEARTQLIDVYEQFADWTNGRLWLYDQQGTVNPKQVCAVVRYAAKELGITHFFVDNLAKCVADEDDYNAQKRTVDELTAIARDYNIHVHLVHHIRKPESGKKPNRYAFKGSGAIVDLVDNTICVHRDEEKENRRNEGKAVNEEKEPDTLLICDKQRNGEWTGQIGLWFDRNSQQLVANYGDEPLVLYRHPEE